MSDFTKGPYINVKDLTKLETACILLKLPETDHPELNDE